MGEHRPSTLLTVFLVEKIVVVVVVKRYMTIKTTTEYYPRDRGIRVVAAEQLLMMTTRAVGEPQYVKYMITLLFTVIRNNN